MFNILPPSPSSPHTMMNSSVDSVVLRKQKKIRSLAQNLLKEISLFVECIMVKQIVEPGTLRELPIFFVKSYNELKMMAKEINYEDAFLNFLPNSVQIQVLTEFGLSVVFPKTVANFFLEDVKAPLTEEIKRLYSEVVLYLENGMQSSDRVKELPVFFHLTVKSLQQRAREEDVTEEEKQMVRSINWKMQKVLEDAFPSKVHGGLVEDSVYAHNLDI